MKSLNKSNRSLLKTEGDEEEGNTSFLPKIENRRTVSSTVENYNFTTKSKRAAPTKDLTRGYSVTDKIGFGYQDTDLIEELKKTIEDQRKEIEQKVQEAMALQRNYDSISSLVKRERDLGVENKRKVASLKEENSKLIEENKLLGKRIEELSAKVSQMEHDVEVGIRDKKKISHLLEDQDAMRKKTQDLHDQIEKKKKEISELEWKTKGFIIQIEKFKSTITGLEEEKQKNATERNELENELAICRKEITEYKERLTDFDKVVEDNIECRKNIQILGKENRDLRSTDIIKDDLIDSLRKKNEALQEELDEKIHNLESLKTLQEETTQKSSHLQDRMKILTTKNEDLETKNTKISMTLVETLNDLTLVKSRLEYSEKSFRELEAQHNEALRKLDEMDEEKFKAKAQLLEEREKELRNAVAKIDHAQSSLVVSLSCCECLKPLKDPVTLLPCGHNYCEKCVPHTPFCKECEGKDEFQHTYKNEKLADVVAKVTYNQVIIEGLKRTVLG